MYMYLCTSTPRTVVYDVHTVLTNTHTQATKKGKKTHTSSELSQLIPILHTVCLTTYTLHCLVFWRRGELIASWNRVWIIHTVYVVVAVLRQCD